MSKAKASTLPSASEGSDGPAPGPSAGQSDEDALFPAETEIYILPDGKVIIADMPAELAHLPSLLGRASSEE